MVHEVCVTLRLRHVTRYRPSVPKEIAHDGHDAERLAFRMYPARFQVGGEIDMIAARECPNGIERCPVDVWCSKGKHFVHGQVMTILRKVEIVCLSCADLFEAKS